MNLHKTLLAQGRTKANLFVLLGGERKPLLIVALLAALTASLLVTTAFNRNSAADTISALTPAVSLAEKGALPQPQEKLRTERVTAFPHGFEPEEIIRTEGQFMLCIDNRAGAEALSLQLTSGILGPVYASPVQKGKSGTNQVLNLQPGQYILTEASHPEWSCTITITSKK